MLRLPTRVPLAVEGSVLLQKNVVQLILEPVGCLTSTPLGTKKLKREVEVYIHVNMNLCCEFNMAGLGAR